jgi:hypothetical protein
MRNYTDINTELEAKLAQLSRARINTLRERWQALFRAEPPKAFGPDLFRRSIAQRIQERHYGGLSATVQRQLNQIIHALGKQRSGHLQLPRTIKSGAVLVRMWKDKSHRVTVLDDGFAFEGRVYSSLSEIARHITGTRWNGPKFFGLRSRKQEDVGQVDKRPRRGRPPAALSHAAQEP